MHVTYDIRRYSKWRRKYRRSQKSPLKPQGNQDQELHSVGKKYNNIYEVYEVPREIYRNIEIIKNSKNGLNEN